MDNDNYPQRLANSSLAVRSLILRISNPPSLSNNTERHLKFASSYTWPLVEHVRCLVSVRTTSYENETDLLIVAILEKR
jgi:hypothetical protein